jgi:hypothetical protein
MSSTINQNGRRPTIGFRISHSGHEGSTESKNSSSLNQKILLILRGTPVNVSLAPRLLSSLRNMSRRPRKRASIWRRLDRSIVMFRLLDIASWKQGMAFGTWDSKATPDKAILMVVPLSFLLTSKSSRWCLRLNRCHRNITANGKTRVASKRSSTKPSSL